MVSAPLKTPKRVQTHQNWTRIEHFGITLRFTYVEKNCNRFGNFWYFWYLYIRFETRNGFCTLENPQKESKHIKIGQEMSILGKPSDFIFFEL